MILINCHLPFLVSDWSIEVCVCVAGIEQADPVNVKELLRKS